MQQKTRDMFSFLLVKNNSVTIGSVAIKYNQCFSFFV